MRKPEATDELTRSELKKARRFAEKRDGAPRIISGYFTDMTIDETEFQTFKMEILDQDGNREEDVQLNVFLPDRRKSYASDVI